MRFSTQSLTTRENHIWFGLKWGMMNLVWIHFRMMNQVQSGGQICGSWLMWIVTRMWEQPVCYKQTDIPSCWLFSVVQSGFHPQIKFIFLTYSWSSFLRTFFYMQKVGNTWILLCTLFLSISDIFLKKARTGYFNSAVFINKTSSFSPWKMQYFPLSFKWMSDTVARLPNWLNRQDVCLAKSVYLARQYCRCRDKILVFNNKFLWLTSRPWTSCK